MKKYISRDERLREARDQYRTELRAWINSVIGRRYPSAQAWAAAASVAATTITRFLSREDAPTPTMNTISKLGYAAGSFPKGHDQMLRQTGIDRHVPEWLERELTFGDEMLADQVPDPKPAEPATPDSAVASGPVETTTFSRRPLPVYWSEPVDGGVAGTFAFEEVGTIPRPSPLLGAVGAFAVECVTNEAFPRYGFGDLLLVNPAARLRLGMFTLILTPLENPRFKMEIRRYRHHEFARGDLHLLPQVDRMLPPQTFDFDPRSVYAWWPIVGVFHADRMPGLFDYLTGDRLPEDDLGYRRDPRIPPEYR